MIAHHRDSGFVARVILPPETVDPLDYVVVLAIPFPRGEDAPGTAARVLDRLGWDFPACDTCKGKRVVFGPSGLTVCASCQGLGVAPGRDGNGGAAP
jgi:hypothetical protein